MQHMNRILIKQSDRIDRAALRRIVNQRLLELKFLIISEVVLFVNGGCIVNSFKVLHELLLENIFLVFGVFISSDL